MTYKYKIYRKEIWIRPILVEADCLESAMTKAKAGDGMSEEPRQSEILHEDEWPVSMER
jgi:hypothetical protein